MTYFPETEQRTAEVAGILPSVSLANWVGSLTGLSGDDLHRLLADGVEYGRGADERDEKLRLRPKAEFGDRETLRPSEVRALDAISSCPSGEKAAEQLGLSLETVKSQLSAARLRLGAKTTVQAVRIAIRTGQLAA